MAVSAQLSSKIESYRPDQAAKDLAISTDLLLVAGPAGAGKNALINALLETGRFIYMVSYTTRPPRPGEVEGEHYRFVDTAEAERLIDSRKFVEVKLVHESNIYGTSVDELARIKASGSIGISDIDVQGVEEFVKMKPGVKAVFVLPPGIGEWMRRLTGRGDEDQDDINRRLKSAEIELEHALEAGHFHFVVNDSLVDAVKQVEAFAEDRPSAAVSDTGTEKAWHVLGELKKQLNS